MSVAIRSVEVLRYDAPQRSFEKYLRDTPPPSVEVPFPIHKYPEFPRTPLGTPGEVGDEFWVRITAEDGTVGYGHSHWGHYAAGVITKFYAPLLEGRDCLAIEFLGDLLFRASQRFGATGIASLARSAIDLALWDLKGKLLGLPVYQLIGGKTRETVQCYVTARNLDWAMELGFKAFKILNTAHYDDGIDGINRLEDHVAACREKVGPDTDLMINPVMSYNVEYAIRTMERLLPYRLRWFEEPLMPHDIDGLAELRRAVPTLPVATGEDHHGRHAFKRLIDAQAADVLQPDIRWAGGLSETLKIYTMAEAAGLAMIPHGGGAMPAGQHFAAAMPEANTVEIVLRTPAGVPLDVAKRIPGMPVPADGVITLSDAPGFGYEFRDEDFNPWPA